MQAGILIIVSPLSLRAHTHTHTHTRIFRKGQYQLTSSTESVHANGNMGIATCNLQVIMTTRVDYMKKQSAQY